ncbi:RHS repeat-associated core domain-containing protein [Flavobacterium oreochromis]|nr:RHS repeat-associated core domain-containing protein [Flavobacterium oreochromis]
MPNRHGSSKPNGYRYGFNGKEDDWQIKGEGNSYDFGARFYDSRIGRFLSLDPLQTKFANLSPYIYAANNPVSHIDQDGKYALFIHYMLTRYKLMKSGISEVVANLIAHYSSTYTNNPASRSSTYEGALMGRVIVDKNVKYSQGNNSIFKSIGGALNGDQAKGILYKKWIDYTRTKDSQSEGAEAQKWHSTRTYSESNIISAQVSINRSLNNAWSLLFESASLSSIQHMEANTKAVENLGMACILCKMYKHIKGLYLDLLQKIYLDILVGMEIPTIWTMICILMNLILKELHLQLKAQ